MRTDDLIAALAAGTTPVPRGALARRLLIAAAMGGVVALAGVIVLYGLRADLSLAVQGLPFWAKASFSVAVAALGFAATARAARPGARLESALALLAAPFTVFAVLAIGELVQAAPAARAPLWLGQTWRSCPFSIAALSLAPLVLLLLALRRLAPTQPARAGFAAGIFAGGIGATAYGLHCPEASASFIATWYALGMLLSGLLGAITGRRVLRW